MVKTIVLPTLSTSWTVTAIGSCTSQRPIQQSRSFHLPWDYHQIINGCQTSNIFSYFLSWCFNVISTLGPSTAGPDRPTVLQAHRPPPCPAKRPRLEICYFAEAAAFETIDPLTVPPYRSHLQLKNINCQNIDSGAFIVTQPRKGLWRRRVVQKNWKGPKKNTILGNKFYIHLAYLKVSTFSFQADTWLFLGP